MKSRHIIDFAYGSKNVLNVFRAYLKFVIQMYSDLIFNFDSFIVCCHIIAS